jgi:hypothetical protein
MMLIWVFIYGNFYNISNRLVSRAENRQKAVESHQKAVKIPQTAAPILTKSIVLHPCHICGLHTKFHVPSSYRFRDIIELHRKTPKSDRNAAKRCTDLNQKFRVASLSHLTAELHAKFKVSSSYRS